MSLQSWIIARSVHKINSQSISKHDKIKTPYSLVHALYVYVNLIEFLNYSITREKKKISLIHWHR